MRNIIIYLCLTFILLIALVTQFMTKEETVISTLKPNQQIVWHERYKHINPNTGYRTSHYQGALPPYVPGGTRLGLTAVKKHFQKKTALFLDVMAHTGTGPDPIDGYWRLSKPRENIPGSVWLADVGTGTLSPEMRNYFQSNLTSLTKADKTKPIIIYCTSGCWMAWNAVRRAAGWGYTNLYWYPEGTDEWKQQELPLEKSTPVPLEIKD